MPTLTEIEAKIRDNVIDVPSATESRIRDWVNEAIETGAERIVWSFLLATSTHITVAGTAALTPGTIPADWVAPRGRPFYMTGSGSPVILEWVHTDEDMGKEHPRYDVTNTGRPDLVFANYATGVFSVLPYPDQNNDIGTWSALGDYIVQIPYIKRPATLTDAVQTNEFTDNALLARYVEDYASAKAMLFNRDLQSGQLYITTAESFMLRAMSSERRRALQDLRITPRRDVHAKRRQWRS